MIHGTRCQCPHPGLVVTFTVNSPVKYDKSYERGWGMTLIGAINPQALSSILTACLWFIKFVDSVVHAYNYYLYSYIRWIMSGSIIMVTLIQTVMLSERFPVLARLTVTFTLPSSVVKVLASNSMVTSGTIYKYFNKLHTLTKLLI